MRAKSQPVPPKIKIEATPALAWFVGIALGAMAMGAAAVLFFFDPSRHVFYPACLFHALTGLYCPGCGGTRAMYQLLHGHIWLALHDNALFVLTLPVLMVWGARFAVRKIRNEQTTFQLRPKTVCAFIVVALIFTVLRNLPAFSWLSP